MVTRFFLVSTPKQPPMAGLVVDICEKET